MNKRSIWAKRQLKRLLELEGDVLDLVSIHEAAIELSLESPLEVFREKRLKAVKATVSKYNKEKFRLQIPLTKNESTQGYVYVVTVGKGKYKIGRTRNVKQRIQTLQTSSLVKIRLVLKVKTSNCVVLEKLCHRKFANKRIVGEWFELTNEDLSWLKNLPRM